MNKEKPFSDKILKEAETQVDNYYMVIKKERSLGFVGYFSEMPMVFGDGQTYVSCFESTYQSGIVSVATLLELGRKLPEPLIELPDIEIIDIQQIIDKIILDGDLRKDDIEAQGVCGQGDDVGFYQQGCAFLIERLTKLEASIQTCDKNHTFCSNSHEHPCPWCQVIKNLEVMKKIAHKKD
jgi:predicted RNase H-like HicB family nuclease